MFAAGVLMSLAAERAEEGQVQEARPSGNVRLEPPGEGEET